MNVPPCKGCDERSSTCHGTCERYKQFVEVNEKIKENKTRDDFVRFYNIERYNKIMKKLRRNRK